MNQQGNAYSSANRREQNLFEQSDLYTQMHARAEELRQKKKYADAAPLYGELQRYSQDPWIPVHYVFCLRKSGELDQALEYLQKHYRRHSRFGAFRREYAWSLYERHIRGRKQNHFQQFRNDILDAADKITQLSRQKDNAPYTQSVLRVVRWLVHEEEQDAEQILHWLNRLRPEPLNTEPHRAGGRIVNESPREFWFREQIRQLMILGRYPEAASMVDRSLKSLPRFFRQAKEDMLLYKAQALQRTGDVAGSLEILQSIPPETLSQPLLLRATEIAFDLKKPEKARDYGIRAALNCRQPLSHRHHFLRMTRIAGELQEESLPLLVVLTRNLFSEAGEEIPEAAVPLMHVVETELSSLSVPELMKLLITYWNQQLGLEERSGRVKWVDQKKQIGFISTDDGEIFFHLRDVIRPDDAFKGGITVRFQVQESFDRKRNRHGLQAVSIQMIQDAPEPESPAKDATGTEDTPEP